MPSKSYRDDLDAAHARIAALEAALRERGDGEEADALREALSHARANRQVLS
jgi:hypothetical protein